MWYLAERSKIKAMASVVDTHPQKQAIIDAILAGESTRSIASRVVPPVSDTVVWRFRRNIVAPALAKSFEKIAQLQQLRAASSASRSTEAPASPIRQSVLVHQATSIEANQSGRSALVQPFVSRMERKYEAYDILREKALNPAEGDPDIKAYSALDAAETRSMDFHARLVGAIAPAAQEAQAGINLMIVLPRPGDAQREQPAGSCIDITCEPAE